MAPASARAQALDNERTAFSLSANAYIQQNTQPNQTAYGAGLGVLLGHGFTKQPASAKDLVRTGFTAGVGLEVPRDANRSFEIGARRSWLKADDALIEAVDKNIYRVHLGLLWRPSRR